MGNWQKMLWEASTSLRMTYHKPVLLHECIELLQLKPGGTYVDVTFGGGGHSREILKQLEGGRLFGFDQDPDAAANKIDDPRFTLIASNFRFMQKMLRMHGVKQVDGILADFGISSHQIDEPQRGFSIRYDAPLDMRMNPEKQISALTVINEYEEDHLRDILKAYGEIKRPWPLVQAIVAARPIKTTGDLKAALQRFVPRQKPARFWAQIFQAIRIEVNEEIAVIEEMLQQSPALLEEGGRIVCMSYHSLEDRPVKNFFRFGNMRGEPEKDFYGNLIRPLEPINRKPITARPEELEQNPRARSAKLRAAEKTNENGKK